MRLLAKCITFLFSMSLWMCLHSQPVKTNLLSELNQSNIKIDAIEAEGPFDLFMTIGESVTPVYFACDRDSSLFKMSVNNHTLHIKSNKKHMIFKAVVKDLHRLSIHGLNTVTVKSPILSTCSISADDVQTIKLLGKFVLPKLVLHGKTDVLTTGALHIEKLKNTSSGIVNIKNLECPLMQVFNTGDGKLFLQGYVNEMNIEKSGSGYFDWWGVSHHITLQAKNDGQIKLSGYTDRLQVDLNDKVSLDASNLFVNHLFVKTDRDASASVYPMDRLFATARHNSQIYYYHKPYHFYVFPEGNGRVLYLPTMSSFVQPSIPPQNTGKIDSH